MRHNIFFSEIREHRSEDSVNKMRQTMINKLKIPPKTTKNITFHKVKKKKRNKPYHFKNRKLIKSLLLWWPMVQQ